MAAPCINDTCSITSSIDAITRRLELDVRYGGGGLQCVDGLGLGVLILGDPPAAAAIDQCFQQLGITPAGELWSIPKRARTVLRVGNLVNIRQNQGTADRSDNTFSGDQATLTNPFPCEAEVLMLVQYRIGFTIINTGSPAGDHGHPLIAPVAGANMIPYGMQVEARVDGIGAGGNFANAVQFRDIGGVVPNALANSNRRDISYAVARRRIGGDASIPLDGYAVHKLTTANENHWFNVSTVNPNDSPPGVFPERGFQASVLAVFLPFDSDGV